MKGGHNQMKKSWCGFYSILCEGVVEEFGGGKLES